MSAEARSVVVRLSLETAQAIANSKEFGREMSSAMDQAEHSTKRAGAAVDDLGNKAGKVGAAAAAGLGLVAKAAIDWESQWAGVTKTVDGSASEMAQLEDELRGLAKTLPATHEEIAGVAEAAGQLGVAREDITDFTKTMIDLGETTNLTADEAATSIAQISNVLGTTGDEVDNFGAALVALGNDGASTEAQILGMAQRIAGAGAQIGLAESDILAIANAASSMGIEVEAGGSAISRVFTELAKATAQGGDDLDAFADVAGMSASEFAAAFEADPARAFASFTAGLNQINQSGGDVFTTLDNLGLADVRVSQALLGMAASGDLLTDSLDLGAQAWEENTALSDEAAKRYGTTASEIRVAWNQIKDAGIQAGEVLLPIIADVADVVGGMADAFGKLPKPVQSSLTGLLAVTAVLGGGLWFTSKVISGIESTRASLDTLSGTSTKASKAMRGVAIAGAGLAALTAAAAGIRAIQEATDETLPGVEILQGRLLDLRDGQLEALGGEFDSLGDSIARITDKSAEQAFADFMQTPFEGLFGEAGGLRQAKAELDSLDQALAALVSSGGPDVAAEAFAALGEASDLSASEMETLRSLLPGYENALAGVANQQRINADDTGAAADATDDYAGASISAAQAAKDEAKAIRDSIKAMEEKRDAALGAFDAETAWRQALKDAAAQAKKNDAGIEGNTKAALNNRAALSDLAGAWNDLSNKAQNTPGRFKAARDAFIQTATDMGVPRDAAVKLAKKLLEIPTKVVTKATVEDQQALRAIDDVFSHLMRLDGTTATTYVHTVRTGADLDFISGGRGRATGGPVWGPGTSTSDSIPARLSNGEYVVKAAAVSRYGVAMMDTINAERFASGGYAGSQSYRSAPSDPAGGPDIAGAAQATADALRDLASASDSQLRAMRHEMEIRQRLLEHEVERDKARLDALRQEQEAAASAVSSAFHTDPFGQGMQVQLNTGLPENFADLSPEEQQAAVDAQAQMMETQFQLQQQVNMQTQTAALQGGNAEKREAIRLLRVLRQHGLNGPAFIELAATGDLDTLRAYADLSRSELAQYERRFERGERLEARLGNFVGNKEFGRDIREQTAELRESKGELRELNQRIHRVEKLLEKAPKETGDEVGKAINDSDSNAAAGRTNG